LDLLGDEDEGEGRDRNETQSDDGLGRHIGGDRRKQGRSEARDQEGRIGREDRTPPPVRVG